MSLIRDKYQDLLYNNAYSRALFTVWGVVLRETKESFSQFFTWKYPVRSFFRTLAFLSNTYGLYRKGWRGLYLDANQKLIDIYPYYRPKDRAVCQLISDSPGERTFYEVQNDILSTTEEEFLDQYRKEGMAINSRKMPVRTLTD